MVKSKKKEAIDAALTRVEKTAVPITLDNVARKINTVEGALLEVKHQIEILQEYGTGLQDQIVELKTIIETTKENIRGSSKGKTDLNQLDQLTKDLRDRGLIP